MNSGQQLLDRTACCIARQAMLFDFATQLTSQSNLIDCVISLKATIEGFRTLAGDAN
jgi:hypothetical protein